MYRLCCLKLIFLTYVFYLNAQRTECSFPWRHKTSFQSRHDVILTLKRRLVSTESEYTYFYIWKNIASNTFLIVFKIVESLQYIFKPTVLIVEVDSNKKIV